MSINTSLLSSLKVEVEGGKLSVKSDAPDWHKIGPVTFPVSFPPLLSLNHHTMQSRSVPLWAALLFVSVVSAHGGHEQVPEGSATSLEPLVRVLFCRLGCPR